MYLFEWRNNNKDQKKKKLSSFGEWRENAYPRMDIFHFDISFAFETKNKYLNKK